MKHREFASFYRQLKKKNTNYYIIYWNLILNFLMTQIFSFYTPKTNFEAYSMFRLSVLLLYYM